MVTQGQIKQALHELGKRATVPEITNHLFLKKIINYPHEQYPDPRVNRILNSLRNWGEVDRTRFTYDKIMKGQLDIWYIVEQMK